VIDDRNDCGIQQPSIRKFLSIRSAGLKACATDGLYKPVAQVLNQMDNGFTG